MGRRPHGTGHLERRFDEQSDPVSWRYTTANDEVRTYDEAGKLVSVTNREGITHIMSYDVNGKLMTVSDPFGRELSFTYDDDSGRIATMTDPTGGLYIYGYGASNSLESVTYPDETPDDGADNPTRLYHYEDSFPHVLTGITDEATHRFASYAYDEKGRAILSEHAGGAERVELSYNADGRQR